MKNKPSVNEFISEFKASLRLLKKVPQVKDHCKKFLKAFKAVSGSYATAADVLREQWIETVDSKLHYSFSIELD